MRAGERSSTHCLSPGAENRNGSSTSVRLEERPDVVEVLENDPLCPHKESQSQGSIKVSTTSPEHRAKRDVTAFDEQGPRERSLIVREFCGVCSPWHH